MRMLEKMPRGKRGEAQDALQEVFIRVWKNAHKWRSFGAWVRAIAKREGLREPPMWLEIMTLFTDMQIEKNGEEDRGEPKDDLGTIPPDGWAVPLLDLIERRLEDDPDGELFFDWIANGCDSDKMLETPRYKKCNKGTLANRISKVRVRLKACLKANGYDNQFRADVEGLDG